MGLSNIKNLLKDKHVLYEKLPVIHVAGSNGKGSTSNILSSIYQNNNYKVGVFTSPHIEKFNERIRINSCCISDEDIIEYTNFFKDSIEKYKCTFFEVNTAIAIKYFLDNKVDLAIIEVGLGGRMDATNILRPLLSVITTISFDHQMYLGNSLIQIAREKAGIIKEKIPVVTFKESTNIYNFFKSYSSKKQSALYSTSIINPKLSTKNKNKILSFGFNGQRLSVVPSLQSNYLLKNISLALSACKLLNNKFPVSNSKLIEALEMVHIKGRMEKVSIGNYDILLDAAHNSEGIKNLVNEITNIKFNKLITITGVLKDKNYSFLLNIIVNKLPGIKIFTKPEHDRGLETDEYCGLFFNKSDIKYAQNMDQAYQKARDIYQKGDLILVTGSHFLLSDFLKSVKNN